MDSSITPCCAIDPSSVPSSSKAQWCRSQTATCSTFCTSGAQVNTCDPSTLDFSCSCNGGTSISESTELTNTIPSFTCTEWKNQCIAAAANDAQQQARCNQQACPSKDVKDVVSESSTAPGTSSSTRTTSSPSTTLSSTLSSTLNSPSSEGSSSSTTTSRNSERPTTSGTSPPATGSSPGISPPGNTAPKNSGLSGGAKAGIAVGVVLGVLVILLVVFTLYKRHRRKTLARGPIAVAVSDEKQVTDPTAIAISNKPELGGESVETRELDASTDPMYGYSHQGQWYQSHQYPPEHYAVNELHADDNPTELEASARSRESNTFATMSAPVPMTHQPSQKETSTDSPHQTEPFLEEVPVPAAPVVPLSPKVAQALTPAEIQALEDEERRIDAELEEVQRLKELREQKFAIQQKLRDAKKG